MTISIRITGRLDTLARELTRARRHIGCGSHIALFFDNTPLYPAQLVMLTSWALEMRRRKMLFSVHAAPWAIRYLKSFGFYDALGLATSCKENITRTGNALPLRLLTTPRAQHLAVNALCDLILKQFDNARALIPAFEWVVNELTDNVFIHAQSPTPCILAAQYFPSTRQLEIALADQGIGFLGTLGPAHGAGDDIQAIQMALTRGLTRDAAIGQGNGLAGTETIVECNRGEMVLWTGKTCLTRGEERQYAPLSSPNGLGIALRLNVEQPVDLGTVWIGEPCFSYIQQYAAALDNSQTLVIAQECDSVGSREPARKLRNTLRAVLPEMDHPLHLDFTGCARPSSSFLDELFGRLIVDIGLTAYTEKLRISGLSKSSLNRANVVIKQRLALQEIEQDIDEYVDF